MWKGKGFLVNSEEGIGKKFRRLCLRNPPASAVPRHPPFARGASSMHPKGSLAKGSWHAVGVTEGFTAIASDSPKSNVKTQKLTKNSSLREGAVTAGD